MQITVHNCKIVIQYCDGFWFRLYIFLETRTSLKNVSFLAYDNSQFRSDEPLGTGVPPTSVVTVNEHGGKFYGTLIYKSLEFLNFIKCNMIPG